MQKKAGDLDGQTHSEEELKSVKSAKTLQNRVS